MHLCLKCELCQVPTCLLFPMVPFLLQMVRHHVPDLPSTDPYIIILIKAPSPGVCLLVPGHCSSPFLLGGAGVPGVPAGHRPLHDPLQHLHLSSILFCRLGLTALPFLPASPCPPPPLPTLAPLSPSPPAPPTALKPPATLSGTHIHLGYR